MKKAILAILAGVVMVLGLTGCKTIENKFEVGDKSDIQITQNNDVTMTVKQKMITRTNATVVLTNTGDRNYKYGSYYELEIKKDGEWHKINIQLNFNLPAYILQSGESKEMKIDWQKDYGELANGTYRLIKKVNYSTEDGNTESFYVAARFNID